MPKTCNAVGCSNNVWGGGYCKYHQNLRTKKERKELKDRGLFTRGGKEKKEDFRQADRTFYEGIWAVRKHECFNCSKALPSEPLTLYFHHLLPKAKYPEFRHKDYNIVILCPDCHSGVETLLDKYPKVKQATEALKAINWLATGGHDNTESTETNVQG